MNNSKQVLLSIVGVAILVVAVVGVSFAFFTYSRTGEQDNIITTGTLTFAFEDGDFINLENQMPMSVTNGKALTGEDNICTFTVKGNAPAGTNISYTVFADPGDAVGNRQRLKDSEVYVMISAVGTGFTPAAGVADATTFDKLSNGILGTGTITGSGTEQTVNFTVKMWISDTVTIAESGASYTPAAYANLYYSMKIRVEANA